MIEFLHLGEDADAIGVEIERRGLILGIDWDDEVAVREIARQALSKVARDEVRKEALAGDHLAMARLDLFGLAGLMLKVMEESADDGRLAHGNQAWKALARALWAEKQA